MNSGTLLFCARLRVFAPVLRTFCARFAVRGHLPILHEFSSSRKSAPGRVFLTCRVNPFMTSCYESGMTVLLDSIIHSSPSAIMSGPPFVFKFAHSKYPSNFQGIDPIQACAKHVKPFETPSTCLDVGATAQKTSSPTSGGKRCSNFGLS